MSKWSKEEEQKLINLWPKSADDNELAKTFNRSVQAICLKARKLKLTKIESVVLKKKQIKAIKQAITNKTILGRDLSDENLKIIASNYHSRSQFAKADTSAYSTARKRRILDDICSHMIVNDTHNYPQTFLFNLLKLIFDTEEIRFNDRTVIHPKEIDIYLPNLKLGFEYDSVEFHQNSYFDEIKNLMCENKEIKLIRIKEENKSNPIPSIVKQVTVTLNLEISDELIQNAKFKTLHSFISKEDLSLICQKYNDLTEFRKKEPGAVKLLVKNGFMSEFTKHMKKQYLTLDEKIESVQRSLSTVKSKNEFYKKCASDYRYLMRNKSRMQSLVTYYNSLLDKR